MNVLSLTAILTLLVFLVEARPQNDWIWSTTGRPDGDSSSSSRPSSLWTSSRYTSPWTSPTLTSNPLTTGQTASTTSIFTSTPFNEEFWRCTRNCPSLSQYNPVCGTNRQTYDNIQKLNCAKRCGESVDVLFYGKCDRREITTSTTLGNIIF